MRMKTLKTENIIKVCQANFQYLKGQRTSLLPVYIEVIDSEWIKTSVLEDLELQFNLLYEFQKEYWTEDDDFDKRIYNKVWIVNRQIVRILSSNKQ